MMGTSLETHSWRSYIHEDLQELLKEATLLTDKVSSWDEKFHDYAFIVFPAAKAYEGFLKTLLHDLKFITDEQFFGKRFRVGKALNPNLEGRLREREGVYDKLVAFCQGKDLADLLWQTWSKGRNILFHWFPNEKNAITFDEARNIISEILETMDLAFRECKIVRR